MTPIRGSRRPSGTARVSGICHCRSLCSRTSGLFTGQDTSGADGEGHIADEQRIIVKILLCGIGLIAEYAKNGGRTEVDREIERGQAYVDTSNVAVHHAPESPSQRTSHIECLLRTTFDRIMDIETPGTVDEQSDRGLPWHTARTLASAPPSDGLRREVDKQSGTSVGPARYRAAYATSERPQRPSEVTPEVRDLRGATHLPNLSSKNSRAASRSCLKSVMGSIF